MAREYTLNYFVRQMPWAPLKAYFDSQGVLGDVNFDDLKKREQGPVVEAMETLDESVRAKIEADFQEIFELATPQGAHVMVDEAAILELSIADMIRTMENHYERAMWLFMNRTQAGTDMFDTCLKLAQIDGLSFTRTRRLKDLPMREPRHDAATLAAMGDALRFWYRRQGRGHKCIVEYYRRPNPDRYYFVAFPEDYTTSELRYDGERLKRQPRKSVFQVVYSYRSDEGVLELHAPGQKSEIRDLQEVFCRYALEMERAPTTKNERCYELNGLKDDGFAFPADPVDGLSSVEVVGLRMNEAGKKRRRVVVEQDPAGFETLYDWLHQVIDENQVPLKMMDVSQAKIRVKWHPEPGKKAKTLTFTLTTPDSSSLKDLPHHEQIKKYLKKWKLAV